MTSHTFGPAPGWSEIEQAVKAVHPLYLTPLTELVYYDGPVVALTGVQADGRVYLRTEVNGSRTPLHGSQMDGPCKMTTRSHYLGFSSEAEARATLHTGTIPTMESYRKAERIVVEEVSWTLLAPCKPTDCQVTVGETVLADLPADDLPYAHLMPGGDVMKFTSATFAGLEEACRGHYTWPLPQRDLLYFWDMPRIWIGDTVVLGQTQVHLLTNVSEERGREIWHRLTFKDEETLRATLYRGYAPTRASYEQATAISREELTVTEQPEHWTLEVSAMTYDDLPKNELPSADIKPEPAGAAA